MAPVSPMKGQECGSFKRKEEMLKETHRIYRNRLGGGGYVMERMTSGLIRRLGKSLRVAEVESGLPEQQKEKRKKEVV